MKRHLPLFLLVPCLSACYVVAGAGAAYVVKEYVERDQAHVAQVSFDVDQVWPSVKETMENLQEPGSAPTVQETPRMIQARVNGAKVTVEVEALDLDLTTIRVSSEKYLSKDEETTNYVMKEITEGLKRD